MTTNEIKINSYETKHAILFLFILFLKCNTSPKYFNFSLFLKLIQDLYFFAFIFDYICYYVAFKDIEHDLFVLD